MNKNPLLAVYALAALLAVTVLPTTTFAPLSLVLFGVVAALFVHASRDMRRKMVYACPALVLLALIFPAVAQATGALLVAAMLASGALLISTFLNRKPQEN